MIEIEPEHEFISNYDLEETEDSSSSKSDLISIKNLSMRYYPEAPLVLNNINFTLGNGRKIAVVGKSGAGKSSLVQALLRMNEPEPNSSYRFSKFDALRMGVHSLRKKIAVLPKTPFFFKGTIRFNLDPFEMHTNENLWKVLYDLTGVC